MTVEEATNRMVREMKNSLDYFHSRKGIDGLASLKNCVINHDVEVETAFKDLIQAIMEEQDG